MTMNENENDIDIDSQEDFEKEGPQQRASLKETWESNPLLKIAAVILGMIVLGGAYFVFIGNTDEVNNSIVGGATTTKDIVGKGPTDAEYTKKIQQQNEKNAQAAAETGGSAVPVPISSATQTALNVPQAPSSPQTDPLAQWRAATEAKRVQMENQEIPEEKEEAQPEVVPMVTPIHPQPTMKMDPNASKALAEQMRAIISTQEPRPTMKVIVTGRPSAFAEKVRRDREAERARAKAQAATKRTGGGYGGYGMGGGYDGPDSGGSGYDSYGAASERFGGSYSGSYGGSYAGYGNGGDTAAGTMPGAMAAAGGDEEEKSSCGKAPGCPIIVTMGTIAYAQLINDLNSDVKGPVMAQVLSGPFSGGRILGKFTKEDEYLELKFEHIVKDGVTYKVDAVALDEKTTLTGLQSKVDHHYLQRVFLPAASDFVKGFADAASQTGTTTTTTAGGGVASDTPKPSTHEIIMKGVNDSASTVSDIIKEDSKRPITVKLKHGTTFGVLFMAAVTTGDVE